MTDFVVAWQDDSDKDGVYQIFCCGFNADGSKSFNDMRVNASLTGNKVKPRAAMAENGDFVVVWMDKRSGHYRIYVRGFYAYGTQKFCERKVSTVANPTFDERSPDVAMAKDGSFKVVWADGRNAVANGCTMGDPNCTSWDNYEVYLRGFSPSGTPDPTDQKVSTKPDLPEQQQWPSRFCPAIGMTPNGAIYVVAWMAGEMEEYEPGPNGFFGVDGISDRWTGTMFSKIHFRGFKQDGTELFPVRLLSPDPWWGSECFPSVAADYTGGFVIAYTELLGMAVRARRFNTEGEMVGDAIPQPREAYGEEGFRPSYPRVASLGYFIVVWMDDDPPKNGLFQISSRKHSYSGEPHWPEKTVNTDPRGDQARPDIAMDLVNGDYVVVWEDDSNENGIYEIMARRFKGTANGISFSDLTVNANADGHQLRPTVAMKLVTPFEENCFIATAAYGSLFAPEVQFLRTVRDQKIRRTRVGSFFVDAYESVYYRFSPYVVRVMHQNPPFKRLMRQVVVAPVVKLLMGIFGPLRVGSERAKEKEVDKSQGRSA